MTIRLIIPKNAEQEIILCFYDYFFNPRDEKKCQRTVQQVCINVRKTCASHIHLFQIRAIFLSKSDTGVDFFLFPPDYRHESPPVSNS